MKADSLQNIYRGFLNLSETDKAEYLKYFALVIDRAKDKREKAKLSRFKTKLENGSQKN